MFQYRGRPGALDERLTQLKSAEGPLMKKRSGSGLNKSPWVTSAELKQAEP